MPHKVSIRYNRDNFHLSGRFVQDAFSCPLYKIVRYNYTLPHQLLKQTYLGMPVPVPTWLDVSVLIYVRSHATRWHVPHPRCPYGWLLPIHCRYSKGRWKDGYGRAQSCHEYLVANIHQRTAHNIPTSTCRKPRQRLRNQWNHNNSRTPVKADCVNSGWHLLQTPLR